MTIRAIFQSNTLSLFNYNTQLMREDDAYEELGNKEGVGSPQHLPTSLEPRP